MIFIKMILDNPNDIPLLSLCNVLLWSAAEPTYCIKDKVFRDLYKDNFKWGKMRKL